MIWRAPSSDHNDCYFCVVPNVHGFNKKNHLFHLQYNQHLMTSVFQFLSSKVYWKKMITNLPLTAPVLMSTKLVTKNLIHRVQSYSVLAKLG